MTANAKIPPSGLLITDDDAAIAAALEEASIPTLMMSMIHMTGDASLLKGKLRPAGCYLNEVQGYMSEEDKAEVRKQALKIISAYRDGGCQLPPPPDTKTIGEMMSFLVVEDVPSEYVPMMMEEMELEGGDTRRVELDAPADARQHFPVVVIGGGQSGVLAAVRLQEAGIPYTIIEKNSSVGGTWYENHYPGCRVDVGNHFYCYSFEPNYEWSEFFAQQPELRRYFETCIDKYELRENFRFNTEVIAARYDEKNKQWAVTLRNADGSEETLQACALISAVGQLNRPKLPDIAGIESFKGPWFHSAEWNHDVDLRGKRVAVIGTGASAFQLVPEVAKEAEQLYVFQRSAPWMFPNENYHRKVSGGKKWALKHLPYYARWYRFLLFWPGADGGLPSMRIDPKWPHQERSSNEINEMVREVFTDWMKQQIGDDEELLAKVVPDYVPMGKRTLQDNGTWLAALKRDNVKLINDPIAAITEDGIVMADGSSHPVDVIVYATGFYANKFLWPMEITGKNGVILQEQWGDEPEAYLGIAVPNFPNLFCMYGPGTNLAHGGSLIFHSECQMRYIMGCLKALLEGGQSTIEVKQQVHNDYNRRLQEEMSKMVWSHPTVKNSWYQNGKGRVTVLSPWRLLDYWTWTKEPKLEEYNIAS